MVVFRVTENINIKTTDGTLVKYSKLRNPANLLNNALYITTYNDKQKLDNVFKKVGKEYQTKILHESKINQLNSFPKELGISNQYEYAQVMNHQEKISSLFGSNFNEQNEYFLNEEFVALEEQLQGFEQDEIKIVILGNVGEHIGEMVAGLTALRLLYETLKARFKTVVLDMYIESSENTFFTRDSDILKTQPYISNIYPLAISVKKFCEYDFYIDNSLVQQRSFYKRLPYVDAFLHKFGMKYETIPMMKKHNVLEISSLSIRNDLIEKLQQLKQKRKLLLFHPYSAHSNRSFPKEVAKEFLKKLIDKLPEYTIVTALHVDDIKQDNYFNLTAYSKSAKEFIYIVSLMDKIITVDTATYHIADAFFIPTVVFFSTYSFEQRAKYYTHVASIQIKDKSKNFSQFKFENEALTLYKFESWKKIKIKKVIKLLETI